MVISNRSAAVRFVLSECRQHAWNCLKNLVKLLSGRQYNFDTARLLFLWRHAGHLTGSKPVRSITVTSNLGEGAGSQAWLYMCTIAYARAAGLTYLHSPFSQMCDADRPMPEWVKLWEDYFNFGAGEIACGKHRLADIDFMDIWNYGDSCDRIIGCLDVPVPQASFFSQNNFIANLADFCSKYYLDKRRRRNPVLSVAVHIRRGDVTAHNHPGYYTSNGAILNTLRSVIAILNRQNVAYKVGVYSQGSVADFQDLALPAVEFFINEDANWTLSELIEADVLLMGKGYFGRYAGLVCDGIRLSDSNSFDEFQPLADWILRAEDGSFDLPAFERQLVNLKAARIACERIE